MSKHKGGPKRSESDGSKPLLCFLMAWSLVNVFDLLKNINCEVEVILSSNLVRGRSKFRLAMIEVIQLEVDEVCVLKPFNAKPSCSPIATPPFSMFRAALGGLARYRVADDRGRSCSTVILHVEPPG